MRTATYKLPVMLPDEVAKLLKDAARRKLMTRSQYARLALLAQLERDGVCPMPSHEAAA